MPRLILPLAAALVACGASSLPAQIRASEPATIVQTVDGTVLTVEYSRPRMRGRDSIWGGEVKWEEVWTPGANYATTLESSKDITIAGHPLKAGKYSVWLVVRPGDTWTAVFDPRARMFHTAHPDSTPEQLRFPVHRATVPFTEVLDWSFPAVDSRGTTLRMTWAGAQVDLPVVVPATRDLAFPQDSAGPYVGDYTLLQQMGPDSANGTARVTWSDGSLWLHIDPAPFPEMATLALLPVRDGWFNPAMVRDGELYDVWGEILVEFEVHDGKATAYAIRGEDDQAFARGTRLP